MIEMSMIALQRLCMHYCFKFLRLILDVLSILFGFLTPSQIKKLPHNSDPILFESCVELSNRIKKGEISCEEVIKAYWKRVQQVQPFINAVVDSCFSEAIAEARRVDTIVKQELSGASVTESVLSKPLLGVPFTCKNSIAVKNLAFDAGSLLLKGNRAVNDAPVIDNLRKSGAIPIALTNVPELVLWWDSDNLIYGRGNNPYDLSRITGGSSGGEAALIAAYGSVVGVGSDIGGSIRIPSMCCGVFGHKTSPGVIPTDAMYPPPCSGWKPYLSFGPLCRYTCDIIPMIKAMAGSTADQLKLDEPVDLTKIKIYYMHDDTGNPLNSPVDPEITESMNAALKHFENKYGVETVRLDFKEMMNAFEYWIFSLKSGDSYSLTSELNLRRSKINPVIELLKSLVNCSNHTRTLLVLACLELFSPDDNSKYSTRVLKEADNLKHKFLQALGNNGVFFYPTLPIPAVKHKTTIFNGFNCSYAMVFNILGFPATHCPTGLSKKNIPIGFQVVAAPFNDRLTIAVASELEKLLGGWVTPT